VTLNGIIPYYPTISIWRYPVGALVNWIYSIGNGNDNIYGYPMASPNVEGQAPQSEPTSNFPGAAIAGMLQAQ
jgi:hypothetical protein